MAVSKVLQQEMQRSSWIRRMFEEAERLKRERGADAIIDLSLGNPVAEPPAKWLDALKAAATDSLPGAHRYMSNAGYPETRAAVAKLVSAEQGVELSYSHVIMSCGAAGGMNVVLKSLLDPGEEVIIFAPFFVEYIFYAQNHNGIPKIVETDEVFQPDPSRLEAALTEKTKAIIINNPNNPTGVVYSVETIKAIVEVLARAAKRFGHPIYLLSDEVYRHLLYDEVVFPSILQYYPDSIVVTSFSKDLGLAGERIGYIAISPRLDGAEQLLAACATVTRTLGFINAPAIMQRSIRDCLDVRVDLNVYRRNREVLCAALAKAGLQFVRPGGAFYVFPRSPDADDVAYCSFLRERGIIAVPGRGFGRQGHIRLSYSVDHDTVLKAAAILGTLR